MIDKPTPDDVKEFLSRCREDTLALELLQERLATVEGKTGLQAAALTGMPKSPNVQPDRIGAAIAQLIPLQDAIKEAEIQVQQRQARTLDVIDLLRQNRVKNWPHKTSILTMRFIDGADWSTIAFALFGGKDDFDGKEDTYRCRALAYQRQSLIELSELVTFDMLDDYEKE